MWEVGGVAYCGSVSMWEVGGVAYCRRVSQCGR